MPYLALDTEDEQLIETARAVLERNYLYWRHTVSAVVLCGSGKLYPGINVESCGYGPCAEPIAIGRALTDGEREFRKIVALGGPPDKLRYMSPCGNCRQLLNDYAPNCLVILKHNGQLVKVAARYLIPDAYEHFD